MIFRSGVRLNFHKAHKSVQSNTISLTFSVFLRTFWIPDYICFYTEVDVKSWRMRLPRLWYLNRIALTKSLWMEGLRLFDFNIEFPRVKDPDRSAIGRDCSVFGTIFDSDVYKTLSNTNRDHIFQISDLETSGIEVTRATRVVCGDIP